MISKSCFTLVLFAAALTVASCRTETKLQFVGQLTYVHSRDGNLMFPAGAVWREYYKEALPSDLINRLVQAIDFAYENGAYREIANIDLDHAHILKNPNTNDSSLNNFQGILLHTQENVVYSPSYKKRNVFVEHAGRTSIIPCERGKYVMQFFKDVDACTVNDVDLNLVEITRVTFVRVDDIARDRLRGYEQNIRMVRGQKILFGIGRYI